MCRMDTFHTFRKSKNSLSCIDSEIHRKINEARSHELEHIYPLWDPIYNQKHTHDLQFSISIRSNDNFRDIFHKLEALSDKIQVNIDN